jgi:predicted MPP superfamily phosphohydrolase
MNVGIALIIAIIVFVVFSGAALLFWYAFRFEVINFQIIKNSIYMKSKNGSENSDEINSSKEDKTASSQALLKILHLSDFHLRTDFKGRKLKNFISILALDNYDFIFITGDMVEKNELQDELIKMLKPLKAKYGTYAVFGAHDYYNKKPQEFIKNMFKKKEFYSRQNDSAALRKKLESIGIHVLQNESIILKDVAGYDEIDIVGADDPLINKMDLLKSLSGIFKKPGSIEILDVSGRSQTPADLISSGSYIKDSGLVKNELKIQQNSCIADTEKILNTKEYRQEFSLSQKKYHEFRENDKLRIALVHTPDSYALVNLAINKIDVVFAGHTHGGQVRVPGIGALISGCNLKTSYAAGLFYFKNFVLQVSKGLGEGRFSRFRIYCDPEALITEILKD